MVLMVGISLAAAAGLIIARYAIAGSRGIRAVIGATITFALTLLFTINVAAGPVVHRFRVGTILTCRIIGPTLTQPAACRPRGIGGTPSAVDGSAILFAGGRRVPIVPGRVKSNIEFSGAGGNGFAPTAEIIGWAASIQMRQPASAVLVFASGRYVGAVGPTAKRPDVDRAFHDPALTLSGFSFEMPVALLRDGSGRVKLQLYALARGVASPMALTCTRAIRQFGC